MTQKQENYIAFKNAVGPLVSRLAGSFQAAFTDCVQVRTTNRPLREMEGRWCNPAQFSWCQCNCTGSCHEDPVVHRLKSKDKSKDKTQEMRWTAAAQTRGLCFLIRFRSQISGVSIREEESVSECFQVLMDRKSSQGFLLNLLQPLIFSELVKIFPWVLPGCSDFA